MNKLNLIIDYHSNVFTPDKRVYPSYADAEDFIERKVEKLADALWDIEEICGSNSKKGQINCRHFNGAEITIKWEQEL